ncbi:MAG: hypothetical protein WA048_01580, partial [Minisyncoccia bacterium]
MKNFSRIAIIALVTISMNGCGVSTSRPSQGTASAAVHKFTYTQDSRTGLCYAMVSTSSALHVNDQGMTITWVPCDP